MSKNQPTAAKLAADLPQLRELEALRMRELQDAQLRAFDGGPAVPDALVEAAAQAKARRETAEALLAAAQRADAAAAQRARQAAADEQLTRARAVLDEYVASVQALQDAMRALVDANVAQRLREAHRAAQSLLGPLGVGALTPQGWLTFDGIAKLRQRPEANEAFLHYLSLATSAVMDVRCANDAIKVAQQIRDDGLRALEHNLLAQAPAEV